MFNLANIIGYYMAWFAIVHTWHTTYWPMGYISGIVFLLAHFTFSPTRRLDILTCIAVTIIGTIIDGFLFYISSFSIPSSYMVIWIPLWLVLIWSIFSVLLSHSLAWVSKYRYLPSFLASIFAPMSYYAGSQLSPFSIHGGIITYIGLAVLWALLFPGLFVLIKYLREYT